MKISKFPQLNAQSILLIYYLTIFTSQGCTFPQIYHLFQKDVQSLPANLHNRFPSCLVSLGVSQFFPLWTVSFYHVYSWVSMFLICSTNNFILPRLLVNILFLICSSLRTASFYLVYQEITVFLIFSPLPVTLVGDAGLVSVHRFPFNSGSLVFSSMSLSMHVHTLCDHCI